MMHECSSHVLAARGQGGQTPRPLTGGSGNTDTVRKGRKKRPPGAERDLPELRFAPADGYQLILQGCDALQEAHNRTVKLDVASDLADARTRAEDADSPVRLTYGGLTIQVMPHGAKGGFRWVLGNDDYLILLQAGMRGWGVSVRYTAGGLWERGIHALRAEVAGLLDHLCEPPEGHDPVRLTRIDWCFDVHAPDFAADMVPGVTSRVVCHSRSKAMEDLHVSTHGRRTRVETMTIGSKARLQVQVYDKTRELTKVSGKTWLWDLWEREGFCPPGDPKDETVWRLEVRMAGEWLRNRNIRTLEQWQKHADALIAEALTTYRLTADECDANAARRPVHPLWTRCLRATDADQLTAFVPLGKVVTDRRSALRDMLTKNLAGTARSAVVLMTGWAWDPDTLRGLMEDAARQVETDERHEAKLGRARERYRYVDAAH